MTSQLVIDTRDGTRLFGDLKSLTNAEEAFFDVEKSDVVVVGTGRLSCALPVSAVRAYSKINVCPADAIDCDAE